jgi:hypothetical protein
LIRAREQVKTVLWIHADGGPEHNVTFPTVQAALICLYLRNRENMDIIIHTRGLLSCSPGCCVQSAAAFRELLLSESCCFQRAAAFRVLLLSESCCFQRAAAFRVLLLSESCCF